MALLSFLAGENFAINYLSGSGLCLFGDAGQGASVLVGDFQGRTFIGNGDGTIIGSEVDNFKYLNIASGIVGQTGSGIDIQALPNYQAPLNIRFTHGTQVNVQNVRLRIYDRVNINNLASGVTVRVAEIIHPGITQIKEGSGDVNWIGTTTNPQSGTTTVGGSGIIVSLANSPATSGHYAGNGSTSTKLDTQHDWYTAISASPDSVGSKLFGLYVSLEYL